VGLGGTTAVLSLNWMANGENVSLGKGCSGTSGKELLIWNQAWWWCDALCDYLMAVDDSVLKWCKYNRWKTDLPVK